MSSDISHDSDDSWRGTMAQKRQDYPAPRRRTRAVRVGRIIIGGNFPVSVQSMTTTDTRDVDATVEQVKRLEAAG